jgi:D-glycerate 3-kinase
MSPSARITWLPLARSIAADFVAAAARPRYIAIAGAQGSGKTTLAEILTEQLVLSGVSAVACSLDDFYLERARRIELSQTVHPLLITRGVPGTHDIELCTTTLDGLTRRPTAMPKFDKGLDDRIERNLWPMAGVADVVVIEGWCLGARPQPVQDLVAPVNELERDEDSDGRWRRFVNGALAGYRTLFARFDRLVFLQVPDFDAVRRWRAEQELQLPEEHRMSPAQLRRFTAHYERLTHWMLQDMPARADVTVVLDSRHAVETFVTKSTR